MRVEIGEGRLVSAPIFPSNRAEDLVELPVQESDLRREFTLQQFTNSFLPLYRWSKTEGGDCRFFVEIIDKDSETKDGYKAARSTIENLFFIRNLD